MSNVRPFAAVRPSASDLAPRICELPYDVMSTEEARAIAAENGLSFLRVSKPEIDLPPGTNPYAPEVYETGKRNFHWLVNEGFLRQDPQPCFYLYRQVIGAHSQVGLVAVASCKEYVEGDIRKHEMTRPEKEDDRVRHIEALNAQTGPAFLTYRAVPEIDDVVGRLVQEQPAIDFTAADGAQHTAWVILEPQNQTYLQAEFAKVSRLYIADGHHRSAAAARIFQERKGKGHSAWLLAVIFPHDQLRIMPYNRVLRDLNGLAPEEFLNRIAEVCEVGRATGGTPASKHEMRLYLAGQWHSVKFRSRLFDGAQTYERLDVSLLQSHILEPVLNIADTRTSQRIQFVGGIRGSGELRKLVDSGEYACAFAMFPTSIEDMMAIADEDRMMPPKSTWFEPKLRDAMFCHLI